MKNSATFARVNYFERQYLRRQEFADEQAYQLALRRRHNIAQHEWGIVVGLEIAVENGTLWVRPGMAIDGYGRELLLPVRHEILAEEFLHLNSSRLDVWLYYENRKSVVAPAGYVACGSGNSDSFYRTNETPRVFLERASVSRVIARRPKVASKAIVDAPVRLETPDDPLVVWPVYLGRITQVPEETDPQKMFLIDASDRPYAGIVAEVVQHPANAARVEVGRVYKRDEERIIGDKKITYQANDQRGFAVFVPSDETELEPRFEIDTGDSNVIRGSTTLYGNLTLAKGAVQFTKAIEADDVERANPSIYRAITDNKIDELRIDLGNITTTHRTFVIGLTMDDGTFKPAMKLEFVKPADDKDHQPLLTIYGDLKLEGLINSKGSVERNLAKEALDALMASFQSGMAAAGAK